VPDPQPQDPLEVPIGAGGDEDMAASDRCAEAMEGVVVTASQGHAFVMEQGRLGMLEGKMGFREGLTHRIVGESGGGQARSQQPAGQGGTPT
jgi:hypothetical protein